MQEVNGRTRHLRSLMLAAALAAAPLCWLAGCESSGGYGGTDLGSGTGTPPPDDGDGGGNEDDDGDGEG